MERERLLAKTFVDVTEALIGGGDVEEFLEMLAHRSAELVGAQAAGVMLTDRHGTLRLASASTSHMHALELFEMQAEQGPCFDAYATGEQVIETDLRNEDAQQRWPTFTPRARQLDLASVHAFPMRFQDRKIGALNIFYREAGGFNQTDIYSLQALADVATLALMQHGERRRSHTLTDQLQHALDSRVLIEQAKGILAAEHDSSLADAFALMRGHARRTQQRLRDVAIHVTERRELPPPAPPRE